MRWFRRKSPPWHFVDSMKPFRTRCGITLLHASKQVKATMSWSYVTCKKCLTTKE
jgi:hypothetical protein